MQMIQKAIDWTDELPITAKAAKRAIDETRDTYNRTIQEHQWALLAQACTVRQRENDVEHMRLMLNRCLLEYRYYDQQDKLQVWCNVHPLIEGIPKFQDALKKVQAAHEFS